MTFKENEDRNENRDEQLSVEELYDLWWCLSPEQRKLEFLTPSEIAPSLDRTPKSVCRMADEGRIPRVKIGGRIYVHSRSLLAKLKQDEGLSARKEGK